MAIGSGSDVAIAVQCGIGVSSSWPLMASWGSGSELVMVEYGSADLQSWPKRLTS